MDPGQRPFLVRERPQLVTVERVLDSLLAQPLGQQLGEPIRRTGPLGPHRLDLVRVDGEIEEQPVPAVGEPDQLLLAGPDHRLEPPAAGPAVVAEQGVPRRCRAVEQAEQIAALAEFRCAGRGRRQPEQVGQAGQFGAVITGRDPARPGDQERHPGRRLEEALLLPAMMITEQVAVVGEEADQRVVRVRSSLYGVQQFADAGVDVADLAVVPRPQRPGCSTSCAGHSPRPARGGGLAP